MCGNPHRRFLPLLGKDCKRPDLLLEPRNLEPQKCISMSENCQFGNPLRKNGPKSYLRCPNAHFVCKARKASKKHGPYSGRIPKIFRTGGSKEFLERKKPANQDKTKKRRSGKLLVLTAASVLDMQADAKAVAEQRHATFASPHRTCGHYTLHYTSLGAQTWTQFFSLIFGHPRISQQNPGISRQKMCSSLGGSVPRGQC